jgi:hypothetical protein
MDYVTISPNPSSGPVDIAGFATINQIQIYSSDGKLIQTHFPNALNYQITDLKSGMYFIEIQIDYQKINSKFIQL